VPEPTDLIYWKEQTVSTLQVTEPTAINSLPIDENEVNSCRIYVSTVWKDKFSIDLLSADVYCQAPSSGSVDVLGYCLHIDLFACRCLLLKAIVRGCSCPSGTPFDCLRSQILTLQLNIAAII
jgi:hypothetical protein